MQIGKIKRKLDRKSMAVIQLEWSGKNINLIFMLSCIILSSRGGVWGTCMAAATLISRDT